MATQQVVNGEFASQMQRRFSRRKSSFTTDGTARTKPRTSSTFTTQLKPSAEIYRRLARPGRRPSNPRFTREHRARLKTPRQLTSSGSTTGSVRPRAWPWEETSHRSGFARYAATGGRKCFPNNQTTSPENYQRVGRSNPLATAQT